MPTIYDLLNTDVLAPRQEQSFPSFQLPESPAQRGFLFTAQPFSPPTPFVPQAYKDFLERLDRSYIEKNIDTAGQADDTALGTTPGDREAIGETFADKAIDVGKSVFAPALGMIAAPASLMAGFNYGVLNPNAPGIGLRDIATDLFGSLFDSREDIDLGLPGFAGTTEDPTHVPDFLDGFEDPTSGLPGFDPSLDPNFGYEDIDFDDIGGIGEDDEESGFGDEADAADADDAAGEDPDR